MKKVFTLTLGQASALENLHHNKVVSASDFDRSALEQLVTKGLAVKHHNGHSVTYCINPAGEAIYRSF
jgi:predicted transcriptional regulator